MNDITNVSPLSAQSEESASILGNENAKFFGKNSMISYIKKKETVQQDNTAPLVKRISQLAEVDKNYITALSIISRERKEAAKMISFWGSESIEEDVDDISDKVGVLMWEMSELEKRLAEKYEKSKNLLEIIKDIEASTQPVRDQKKKLVTRINKLQLRDPTSLKLFTLDESLARLEAESLVAEAQLSNVTREKLKQAFTIKFDALSEFSQSLIELSKCGKEITDLLNSEPLIPGFEKEKYDGREKASKFLLDLENFLHEEKDESILRPELHRLQQFSEDDIND